jgi:hypothetical protein
VGTPQSQKRRAQHVGFEQHIDREALKQQREARPRLSPRHARLFDSIRVAANARDARAQLRLELAAVHTIMPSRFPDEPQTAWCR